MIFVNAIYSIYDEKRFQWVKIKKKNLLSTLFSHTKSDLDTVFCWKTDIDEKLNFEGASLETNEFSLLIEEVSAFWRKIMHSWSQTCVWETSFSG